MIRVYYLTPKRIDSMDTFDGIEHVHHAVVNCAGALREVVMDTTEEEHAKLAALATSWRQGGTGERKLLQGFLAEEAAEVPVNIYDEIQALKDRLAVLEACQLVR